MELYNAECIQHMKTMEEKSVDLFVLDLPYANKVFGKCTAMGWDTPIDLTEMWVQIKRIMKPSAVIVHFCNVKFGFALIQSNPKWFRYDLIWKKSRKVGFLSANKQPLRQHENMYVFKQEQGVYNPQKVEGKPYNKYRPTQNITTISGAYGKIFKANKEELINDRHPSSIIERTILEHNNPHKPIHRTQKPVSLLEWLIKSYSNEGDVVMDFCMGSGTAGIACLNTKRYFIGVEKDEEIFNLATKRIEEHKT
jgi:site-specific DNA-methyltransferase (adenine-specific)